MSNERDYIEAIEGAERRYFTSTVERRMEGDGDDELPVIEGYAALFNSRTNLGWMQEEILPGAFDDVLNNDVRCLFNHNSNYVLARSVNGQGTLTLELDEKGLKYRYTTPDRSYARDLADAIDAGDVSQSSFAFSVEESVWIEREGEEPVRQIVKLRQLYDVAPVTYPAYSDTSVAKRSLEINKIPEGKDTMGGDKKDERTSVRDAQLMLNQNKA